MQFKIEQIKTAETLSSGQRQLFEAQFLVCNLGIIQVPRDLLSRSSEMIKVKIQLTLEHNFELLGSFTHGFFFQ